ncbi:MAG: hypothetical protein JXR97_03110 [Planctomycetes bacterium]|nr:hypothetical protein [Planctomycetota bacterium]
MNESEPAAPEVMTPELLTDMAMKLKCRGASDIEIGSMLMSQGLTHEEASLVLQNLPVSEEMREQIKENNTGLAKGVLALLAGIMITMVSYSNAGPGKSYTIASGLIAYGMWKTISSLMKPKDL